LTVWGAVVTFSVCAMLCAILYAGVFFSLRDEIDTFIEGEVRELIAGANGHEGDDSAMQEMFRRELGARTFDDLAFRLYDTHGRLLVTSRTDDRVAALWQPGERDFREPTFETITESAPGLSYRLCSLRATLHDGRECIAQAGYSLKRMNASLAELGRIIGVALLLSIVASVLVGRFLATRSLRPMRAIADDARAINAERLEQRIRSTGTRDELDRIVTAFNDLLARTERHVIQLRQFTADASHELRTPLAALRGMAEVALSKERGVDELRHVLEDSIPHFERLQRIAEDLLLLARLDAGEPILRREPVDLDRIIHNVLDLYRPMAEDRGVELTVGDTAPVTIVADSERLQQVVCNLVDNAVKYTESGGSVTVSLSRDDGAACVTVADTGIGIPADSLPRVFDRFYRSDHARASTNGGGVGLGLSLCRSITEAHDGEIRIDTEVDRGTSVVVTLPSHT